MKSTLAFLLILLAFQLEWTHPRAFEASAVNAVRFIACSPGELTDSDHRHTPPGRASRDTSGNDGVLENDDDLTDPHFHLVNIFDRTRVDRHVRCSWSVRRQPFAALPPATVGATLRC
jgi:hypothetical protein